MSKSRPENKPSAPALGVRVISAFRETSATNAAPSSSLENVKRMIDMEMERRTTATNIDAIQAAERIYHAWDEALGRKDLDGAMRLYAPDAILESPLVRHLLGSEEGVIHGRDNLREFVEKVFARTPSLRQRRRDGFFTDGKRLIWEYPRLTEDGQQMDLVEAMDIVDGLIQRHCVYWGWLAVKVLEEDRYRPG
jgi:hypothetical protein